MNSNEQFERDFEQFVNEDKAPLTTLYRKLPQPEPDAQIDAAVRAIAHRAVATTVRTPTRHRRWLPVLATAASLVLAAGIAMRMRPHTDIAPQSIHSSARDKVQPAQPPIVSTPMASPAPAAQVMQVPDVAEATPPPAPPAAPSLQMVEPIAQPPAKSPAPEVEQSISQESRVRRPQAFPPPAQPSTPAKNQDNSASLATGRITEDQNESAATAAQAKPTLTPAYSAELIRNSELYPESWIAAIRRLIQAGRNDEARQNIDYFRKKHPRYHLPADIDQFAGQPR